MISGHIINGVTGSSLNSVFCCSNSEVGKVLRFQKHNMCGSEMWCGGLNGSQPQKVWYSLAV